MKFCIVFLSKENKKTKKKTVNDTYSYNTIENVEMKFFYQGKGNYLE